MISRIELFSWYLLAELLIGRMQLMSVSLEEKWPRLPWLQWVESQISRCTCLLLLTFFPSWRLLTCLRGHRNIRFMRKDQHHQTSITRPASPDQHLQTSVTRPASPDQSHFHVLRSFLKTAADAQTSKSMKHKHLKMKQVEKKIHTSPA